VKVKKQLKPKDLGCRPKARVRTVRKYESRAGIVTSVCMEFVNSHALLGLLGFSIP